MRTTLRALIAPSVLLGVGSSLLLGVVLFAASAQAAPAGSGYTARAVCAAPAPGHASCLALRLVPSSGGSVAALRARGAQRASPPQTSPTAPQTSPTAASPASVKPVSPTELHHAYELPLESAAPQTIAVVDAYDDPKVEADLKVFDEQFGLPACNEANGCFTKVNEQGQSGPLPAASGEWSIEIATDVEVAHSVCQNCRIVLLEAASDEFSDLDAAENTAAKMLTVTSKPGKLEGVISNSWGGEAPSVEGAAFNHPGIVITASAGDSGYLNWTEYGERAQEGSGYFEGPDYPAASPDVIAVGGTSLKVHPSGEWESEKVWNNSIGAGGGGCGSAAFPAPSWQSQVPDWSTVGCGSSRAVADVAADADPDTGVHVYDSVPEPEGKAAEPAPEWLTIGGTSVASPIIASAFALAGGAQGVAYPAATLYAHLSSSSLHDVAKGGNGECDGIYPASGCNGSLSSPLDCGAGALICNAATGYDGPTGVGTPDGLSAFQPVPGEIGGPGGSSSSGGSSGSGSGSSPGGGSSGGSGSGGGSGPGGGSGSEGGSGSGGGGSGGGAGSGGSGGSTGSGGSPGGPVATPGTTRPAAAGGAVLLTHLSLTLSAVAALTGGRAPLSRVAFTFTLSAAAKVRVTLARRVRARGHWTWSTLPGANSLSAHAGVDRAHLSGRGALAPGFYRLTLTPAHGTARSLAISIG